MDIRETIGSLFDYEEMGIRRFSKDTYAPSFDKFEEIAKDFDRELDRLYETACGEQTDGNAVTEKRESPEEFCNRISRIFVDYVKENKEQGILRGKQDEKQLDHNMFMAVYVLPHIMEMRNPYYKELAAAIEKNWSAAFKNSRIKAATFESVAGGFQRKLFGFTI